MSERTVGESGQSDHTHDFRDGRHCTYPGCRVESGESDFIEDRHNEGWGEESLDYSGQADRIPPPDLRKVLLSARRMLMNLGYEHGKPGIIAEIDAALSAAPPEPPLERCPHCAGDGCGVCYGTGQLAECRSFSEEEARALFPADGTWTESGGSPQETDG